MSNAKHTEGPWKHYDDSEAATHRHVIAAMGKTVAHIYCTRGMEAEDAANARLIAAAPELLAVAKRCLDMVEEGAGPPNWDWIRDIIAKAEGRTDA